VELRHLRYFAALASRLNFTQAAAAMHVTQSTLSQQINQLEDELGKRLLNRNTRTVTLTDAGEEFLLYATKALRDLDDGVRRLKSRHHEIVGGLRIGAAHTFNLRIIPTCLSQLLRDHPNITASIEELPAASIEQKVLAEEIDLGIAYLPADSKYLRFEALYSEEMLVVVSKRHPWAGRKRIRMIELDGAKLVLTTKQFLTRQMLDGWLHSVGAEPTIVVEMNATAPMLRLVRETNIATIVSEQALFDADDLKAISIEDPTPIRNPGLLFKRGIVQSPAAKAFAAIVRREVQRAKFRKPV
jgi:LysR family cyn operon transcriptional activator